MNDNNPYASSQAAPDPKPVSVDKLELMRSYQFVMESENWITNLMMGSLAILSTSLIPIVGQLVFDGYRFEVIEGLHRSGGRERGYPDFDMNKILDYLVRGLWPFLVSLLLAFVIILPVMAIVFIGVFALLAATGSTGGGGGPFGGNEITLIVVVVGMMVVMIALSLVASIIVVPFWLRAGLSQDIGVALNFGWAKDFIGRMWWDILVSMLFLMLTGMFVSLAGLLMCFIGIYPAVTWASLAQAHLIHQLYEIYLSRGGEPIPLKDSVVRVF